MQRLLLTLGAAMLVCATVPQARAQGSPTGTSRAMLRNSVGLELLGKAGLYSFSYQRMVSVSVGLDVGFSVWDWRSEQADGPAYNTWIIVVPLGATWYLNSKDGSLLLAGGGGLATGSELDHAIEPYGYAGLGFEYRSAGGFLFRGTVYGFLAGAGSFIWPGLSIGYAF